MPSTAATDAPFLRPTWLCGRMICADSGDSRPLTGWSMMQMVRMTRPGGEGGVSQHRAAPPPPPLRAPTRARGHAGGEVGRVADDQRGEGDLGRVAFARAHARHRAIGVEQDLVDLRGAAVGRQQEGLPHSPRRLTCLFRMKVPPWMAHRRLNPSGRPPSP